jgi:hypothetical protein
VSGLATGSTLVLTDVTPIYAGPETLVIKANGAYSFSAPVLQSDGNAGQNVYQVSIEQQPVNQNCVRAYNSAPPTGPVTDGNITTLNFICTAAYTLTGSVGTSGGQVVTSGFVTITGTQPFPGSSSNSKMVYFDVNGDFQLPVPLGTYTVTPDTGGGQEAFSPVSVSVVVGSTDPVPIAFTCVLGCPSSGSVGSGGSVGTGSGGSGGGAGGTGSSSSCSFSSCITPLPANCIALSNDPAQYNWISFTNKCGQSVYLTFNAVGTFGLAAMNLASGQSATTGLANSEVPNGFRWAVCPFGFVPWTPTSNTAWNGSSDFICVGS